MKHIFTLITSRYHLLLHKVVFCDRVLWLYNYGSSWGHLFSYSLPVGQVKEFFLFHFSICYISISQN